MKQLVILVSAVMVLGGCQSVTAPVSSESLDNAAFMRLWVTYRDCQSGMETMNLDAMRAYERQLDLVARNAIILHRPPLPLPRLIQRWVTEPKPRFAVDPGAMAAACTLYTGQAALQAGRNDVAVEMFRAVLIRHPEKQYAYYTEQARDGLQQVSIPEVVQISTQPVAPHAGLQSLPPAFDD